MSAIDDTRRRALAADIGAIMDDYLSDKISYLKARAIFKAPTCRVAIEDLAPYLGRTLEMVRTVGVSRA